ncbi:MAG: hypothetical protein NVSMB63_05450 [Sediminibacterium sp.]
MAATTASGQLRSAGRQGSSIADELISVANDTRAWKKQVLAYAKTYAKKAEDDYQSYLKAYLKQNPVK